MEITFHHKVTICLEPKLERILMSLFDDLNAKLDDLAQTVASETDEIKEILSNETLTPDQVAELTTKFDSIKNSVTGISDNIKLPVAPEPEPTPEPTPVEPEPPIV